MPISFTSENASVHFSDWNVFAAPSLPLVGSTDVPRPLLVLLDGAVPRHTRRLSLLAKATRPVTATVVFYGEGDYEVWDSVAEALSPTVEDLTVVNFFGECQISAPSVPPLHAFARLRSFALHEMGWCETECSYVTDDLLTRDQAARLKKLEIVGVHLDVVDRLITPGRFKRLERLVLRDANPSDVESLVGVLAKFPKLRELVMSATDDDDEPERIPAELARIAAAARSLRSIIVECDDESLEEFVAGAAVAGVVTSRPVRLPDYSGIESEYT